MLQGVIQKDNLKELENFPMINTSHIDLPFFFIISDIYAFVNNTLPKLLHTQIGQFWLPLSVKI